MNERGWGKNRHHISKNIYRIIFGLRIVCLSAVSYGLYAQFADPLFQALNRARFGGPFEFLTIISATITIITMTFGIILSILGQFNKVHMHMVALILPIEMVVTLCSWAVYFLFPEGLLSPQAIAAGYKEYDLTIHTCLHLFPLLGLTLDFVSELDSFKKSIWQGLAILIFAIVYLNWVIFLYYANGRRWVYHVMGKMQSWQWAIGFLIIIAISLGTLQLMTLINRYTLSIQDSNQDNHLNRKQQQQQYQQEGIMMAHTSFV